MGGMFAGGGLPGYPGESEKKPFEPDQATGRAYRPQVFLRREARFLID